MPLGAFETARAIVAGRTTSAAEVEAAIARIEAANPSVNAVIIKAFSRARDEAKKADEAIARGERRPLLGVPVTVKESNKTAGEPYTWGIAEFKDNVEKEDGPLVRMLRAAGAIILGKTNIPPYLGDIQTNNPIWGRTVNPYNPGRTCGGSSGGSAVALATGMVPLEMGSDIGGSIRTPSHFCGTFGHKPTHGIVPEDGFPLTDGHPDVLSVAGPMARSAEDLAGALDIVSTVPLAKPRFASLKGVRILVITQHPVAKAMKEIVAGVEAAAARAEAAGAFVSRSSDLLPDLAKLHETYWQLLVMITTRAMQPVDAEGKPPSATKYFELLDEQARAKRAFARFFESFDCILMPVHGCTAFPHDDNPKFAERILDVDGEKVPYTSQFAWIGPATVAQLPSTSVPIGRAADGLPYNMQVVCASMRDHDAIAIGGMLAVPNAIVVPQGQAKL
ncbi:amidase [Hyaloraphidium curvatum]|nr:amidase [Hyaloraphidium curvatum]